MSRRGLVRVAWWTERPPESQQGLPDWDRPFVRRAIQHHTCGLVERHERDLAGLGFRVCGFRAFVGPAGAGALKVSAFQV